MRSTFARTADFGARGCASAQDAVKRSEYLIPSERSVVLISASADTAINHARSLTGWHIGPHAEAERRQHECVQLREVELVLETWIRG